MRYSSAGAAILSHQILRVVRKKNSYFQSPSTQMSAGMFFSFSAESHLSHRTVKEATGDPHAGKSLAFQAWYRVSSYYTRNDSLNGSTPTIMFTGFLWLIWCGNSEQRINLPWVQRCPVILWVKETLRNCDTWFSISITRPRKYTNKVIYTCIGCCMNWWSIIDHSKWE